MPVLDSSPVFGVALLSVLAVPELSVLDVVLEVVELSVDWLWVLLSEDASVTVNDVSADVSTEGNVSYNISYTWGSEDTDFPSVPRAVTASYRSDENEPLYDISLYRDSFTPNSKIADGKTVDNWFDDWEVTGDDDSTHQPLQEGDLHGFRITSNEDSKKANSGSIYTTSSFYFAVQEEDGVSVYVLEGILYDPGSLEECDKALSGSIRSITIKKQA